jgi:thioredoxin reductase
VLELIDGSATIVQGSHCVGHGACEKACPVNAIELVFGSEKRGIDIPAVGPDFQTNVDGIYVAGELGGMGLIANAIQQGVEAMDYLVAGLPSERGDVCDVLIVGAGPAGLGAGLRAKELGLRASIIEQDRFGGAIRHYPRQKLVMTRPIQLPGYGTLQIKTIQKERLVELFEQVIDKCGLEISDQERVERVESEPDERFIVHTNRRSIPCHRVLLAVGRRGTPRRLGVPGEDHEKVAYRLIDPELFHYKHILIVGGGDSAVEAACSLSEQPGNTVTLSYRRDQMSRPKPANQARLSTAVQAGRVALLLSSVVQRIDLDRVQIQQAEETLVLPNDFVFVFAGGMLPTQFLEAAGIQLQTHFGQRVVDKPASHS